MRNFIVQKREVNSNYHFKIAIEWKNYGKKDFLHSALVYSAFEFRIAIERFAFELLLFIVDNDKDFSAIDIEKVNKFQNIFREIYSIHNKKEFERILIFNHHASKAFTHGEYSLAKISLSQLQKYWKSLSNYCHKILKPIESWDNEEWVKDGYTKLEEIESYFSNLLSKSHLGWLSEVSLKDEALIELRNNYINGLLTEEQLCIRLKLIVPVLDSLKGQSNNLIFLPKYRTLKLQ